MSTPVGIILPPADIRKIVDKTAEFVAKNGQSFEELVIKAETNNQKFSFLKKDDPYRPYYESQVTYFEKQLQNATTTSAELQPATIQKNPSKNPELSKQYDGPHIQPISFFTEFSKNSSRMNFNRELRAPLPEVFSVPTPKNLLPLEVDIMKHTAQFVALHGQKFLMEITEREKNNAQFDFVKPNNIYFTYFTKLIDAYSRCIQPKKEDIIKIQQFSYDINNILQKCFDRFEYENNQEQSKMIQERLAQEERFQIEQIDWNDFIVVETIDLFDNEDLPPPEKQKDLLDSQKLQPEQMTRTSQNIAQIANQQKQEKEQQQFEEQIIDEDDENSQFIPESSWLKNHPGQISIFIKVPDEGGEETWKLNGQILELQFDPKTTIGQIKAELSQILLMPSLKQKLRIQNLILKDNNTLAYYNIMNSCSIELNVKERGGENDYPLYEIQVLSLKKDIAVIHHLILHSTLDNIDEKIMQTNMYLGCIEKQSDANIYSFITASRIKFLLLTDGKEKNDEAIKQFFLELYDIVSIVNPLYEFNTKITSKTFDDKTRQLLKKYFQ